MPGVARVQVGQQVVVFVRDVGGSVAPVVLCLDEARIRIASVEVARASLDDVFLRYTGFFAPSMVVLAVLFTALQSGLATMTDIDSGMLDKFRIMPMRRSSILLGRVLADAVTMLLQVGSFS